MLNANNRLKLDSNVLNGCLIHKGCIKLLRSTNILSLGEVVCCSGLSVVPDVDDLLDLCVVDEAKIGVDEILTTKLKYLEEIIKLLVIR